MEYVCDAPHKRTWFRLMTEGEAVAESLEMHHAVEKHYRRERERAIDTFHPTTAVFIEQDINKEDHIRRTMPLFLTLRDEEGTPLATAIRPRPGPPPAAVGNHYGFTLDRTRCSPYRR